MNRQFLFLSLALLFLTTTTYFFWTGKNASYLTETSSISSLEVVLSSNQITEKESSLYLSNKNHKAVFSPEGVLFVPENEGPSLSWKITSDFPMESKKPRLIAEEAGSQFIVYQRAGIQEKYRIGEDFIEQQFVLEEMPELRDNKFYLEGDIQCEGEFIREEEHWVWKNKLGKVRLGDVTVYDANRQVLAASMIVEKDQSTIIVDGSALASATYPVTIDPILDASDINYSSSPSGRNAKDPEVAYNPDDNEYVVVFPGDFATAGTADIYAQRVNALTGAKVGSRLQISSMPAGQSARDPDIVYNETSNEFFVVWNTGPSTQKVLGRRVSKNLSSVLGSEITIGNTTTVSLFLLGNRIAWNSTNNEYFVVFSSVTTASVFTCRDIKAQRISATGTAVGGLISVETASCTGPGTTRREYYEPDVAYNNDKNEYLVVYRGADSHEFDFEVFYERYSNTGSNLQGKTPLTATTTPNNVITFPRVAYNRQGSSTGKYLVTFQNQYGTTANAEVYGQVIDGNGATTIGSHFALSSTSDSKSAGFAEVLFNPQNNEFLAMVQTINGGFPDGVFVQRLNASAAKIGSLEAVSTSLLFNQVEGGMAIRKNTTEALVVYEAGFPQSNVFGRRYTTVVGPPPLTASCQNLTLPLNAAGNASISASALNGGSSGGTAPLAFAASKTSFTCSDIGINTVTLTVTDANGASATCTATVTVSDVTAPTATCQHATIQIGSGGTANVTPANIDNGSIDACSGTGNSLSRIVSPTSFNCSQLGQHTVTLTVNDAPGNPATCTATVTVLDNSPPDISNCASLATIQLDATGNATIAESDIPTYVSSTITENCSFTRSLSPNTFNCGNIGGNTVTLTVTDPSGNSDNCTATVTVTDPLSACCGPPTAHCKNATVNLNTNGSAQVVTSHIDNGSTAPCGLLGMGLNTSSFGCNDIGPNQVQLTVTDAKNVSAYCTATVTVEDNISPTLSLLGADPIVICEGEVLADPGATITDNCASGTVVGNVSGVNTAQQGNYSITYDYSDPSGNAATQITRTVIVNNTPAQLAPQNCGSCSEIRFDVCEGETFPNLESLLMSNANYESGISFNWYADNGGSQGGAIGMPSLNTNTARKRYYWVSQQDGNCEGPARKMRVRIRATSTVVFDVPALGCNGGQINLANYVSDSRGKASSFTFYDSDPDVGSPTPLGTVSATNGVVNTGQQTIVSVPPNPITYYATAGNNTGCQVTASDQVISSAVASLNPISPVTVSAGDLVNVNFSGTNTTLILWYDIVSFNNPNIGIMGAFGAGNLMFTAVNSTNGPLTATIRVIPYNGNCAGTFQDLTITVNPGTIPRQARNMLDLKAQMIDNQHVQLNWDIQYEFELTHFEVEKLQPDGSWKMLAEVPSLTGEQNYTYVDGDAHSSVQTYRLKLVHADGRAVWSREVKIQHDVRLQEKTHFKLFPNPSQGRFNLIASMPLIENWHYTISDQIGRTIQAGSLTSEQTSFDITPQPLGFYYLILTNDQGDRQVHRVVRQ